MQGKITKMKDCRFCQIYENGDEVFYESKYFFSILDKFPVYPRHAVVIPKRHVLSLGELNCLEWNSLRQTIDDMILLIENSDLRSFYSHHAKYPF